MNKQKELLKKTEKAEDRNMNNKVKELKRQYQKGELSSMDALKALRELLIHFN